MKKALFVGGLMLLVCNFISIAETSNFHPQDLLFKNSELYFLQGETICKYVGNHIISINDKINDIYGERISSNEVYVGATQYFRGKRAGGGRRITQENIVDFAKFLKVEPRLDLVINKVIYPQKIAFGPNNCIFAVGQDIFREAIMVAQIDPDDGHTISTFKLEGIDKNRKPTAIAVNQKEEIYVIVGYLGGYVYHYAKDGKLINKWGGYGDKNGQFKAPWAIAIDLKTEDVYVSDIYMGEKSKPEEYPQRRIQVFDRNGKYKRKWGGNKIRGINWFIMRWDVETDLGDVVDITVDSNGDVYLLEQNRSRVSKLTNRGVLLKRWGKYGAKEGEFNDPQAIAIGPDDNVYVADTGNNRIQKFDENGKFLGEIK